MQEKGNNKEEIKRLEKHISALEKSYDNIIEMLNEDIERDDESGKIKLKDAQRKVFSEGIAKASETADSLLKMITLKYKELNDLKNPPKETVKDEKVPLKKVDDSDDHPLSKYIK